jgi:MFS transporter, ACS family, D-galactonate transporter
MDGRDGDGRRWLMLAIVSLGYVSTLLALTGISPAFPMIAKAFGAGYLGLAVLISSFLAGLAVGHIPSGLLATRIGVKRALVLGLLVQAVASVLSARADSYVELAICRFVVGLGASTFASVAVGAISAWFEGREITLALGVGMAANSAGTAIGLYLWVYVVQVLGWRGAVIAIGAIALIAALVSAAAFSTPKHLAALEGGPVTGKAIRQILGDRQLWIYGLAFIGAYGAYMTTIQLIAGYAIAARHFSAADAGLLAACIGLSGIPGSIAGGWLADRARHSRKLIVGPIVVMSALILAIPLAPSGLLWLVGVGEGFLMQFVAAVWSSVPRRFAAIPHEHVSTAMGLLLTIAAFGGFFVPIIFGHLIETDGYFVGWMSLGVISAAFGLNGLFGADSHDADIAEADGNSRAVQA